MLYITSSSREDVKNIKKNYKQIKIRMIRSTLLIFGSHEPYPSAYVPELQPYLAEIPQRYHLDRCSCIRWTV